MVHLFGFTKEIYHDAQTYERQTDVSVYTPYTIQIASNLYLEWL
jgi:hypothetical protein